MAVLLDTHTFLWWCEDSAELSAKARKAIANDDCFVSMESFWEIAIKVSLGKLALPDPPEKYLPSQMAMNGFDTLEIAFRHTVGVARLPWHHRDPFDRLLAAQALEEKLPIVSRDIIFDSYGLARVW